MEEIDIKIPIIKAVKKATYNGIINQAHLNINPENYPIKKMILYKSHSFKKITNFVPNLKPKKSTFMPTPLKLNNNYNINYIEKENNDDKQLSGDEIQIIDSDSSCSSLSSSNMNNTSGEEKGKDKENKQEINFEISKNNNSTSNIEKIESNDIDDDCDSFQLNEIQENTERKKITKMRKKMSQIKAKFGFSKFKESGGIIHDNFKNNFNIGLKQFEEENDFHLLKHCSINAFENKKDHKKPLTKSILDVLSNSKNSFKK